MVMMRKILLTAIMASFATLSHAGETNSGAKRFDGTVRLTVTGGKSCTELVPPNNDRASFFIYEDCGCFENILTRFRDDDQAESIIFETDNNYNVARAPRNGEHPQFVGFLLFQGLPVFLSGEFDLAQDPPTIGATTKFVSLSGTLFDYPFAGCKAELKATLARSEDFVEPSGPAASHLVRQLRNFRAKATQR